MRSSAGSILSNLFRIGVGFSAIGYVIWKTYEDRDTLIQTWEDLGGVGALLILSAFLMVVPNLLLEAWKWRLMVQPYYPKIKIRRALKAILAGMATGIFTPNRIGEYAGRLLYLDPGHRIEAMVGTFFDRISQQAVTLLAGIFILIVICGTTGTIGVVNEVSPVLGNSLLIIASIMLGIVFTLLIFPKVIVRLIPPFLLRYQWAKQIKEGASTIYSASVLRVFGLSLLRYTVFSTQYVLLLNAMGWSAGQLVAFAMVALVFLAKSIIPVPGILELGVRETIAIEVFRVVGFAPAAAVQSTFLLYVINIILPTLLGIGALKGIKLWEERKKVLE